MQYMLLIYGDETSLMDASPEDQATGAQAWVDYTQWLKDEGGHVAGDALHPTASATTLRFDADGKTLTTDGPFAETKEQLGGLYVVDVPDLDAALAIAARLPSALVGSIEVRPIPSYGG
jgi:hypothetical protein